MERAPKQEISFHARTGWLPLAVLPAWLLALLLLSIRFGENAPWPWWVLVVVTAPVALISLAGFFIVNPNMGRVLVLFGKYRGTVREEGFYWTNPFTVRQSVSLKARNIASQTIKVNDMLGNPIEIGAVVVWQVRDTAQALFDVDDYEHYVDVQIETAVRELAKAHPYDDGQCDGDVKTLRGDSEIVSAELMEELHQRLVRAGLDVLEARISHLAYASEIAGAMLQRQQAVAIIAARKQIVEGAVSMVEQALEDLGKKGVVQLDDERRATLVGNLLVVLCGQTAPQPVVNTGSLYN